MKKLKRIKISYVITISFLVFSVIILGFLWIFQVIFLGDFYRNSALNECKETANTVFETYLDDSDAISYLKLDDEIGIKIYRVGSTSNVMLYSNVESVNRNDYIENPTDLFDNVNSKGYYFSISNGYLVYIGSKVIDYQQYNVILTRPSEDTRLTVNIVKNQMLALSIGSLALCVLMALILGKRISKPINDISDSVELLGPGKYDINFPGGPYFETQKLSTALRQTAIEINKADQFQRDVMANVSHDIKTPLTLIKSYAEMIRDISGDDKNKRDIHLQTILDETDKLTSLINDILALSKAQADVQDVMKEFSLSSAVNESIVHFEEHAITKKIQFGYDIADHIHIVGNQEQISEVIYNYFSNAFNYTTDKIFVNLYTEGNMAVFEVTDNGSGISEEELTNIWQRYYRSANTHARTKGTGLGLSIVQTILDKHHYKFGVTSEVGVGSTFYFKAPLVPVKRNG